ncbi:hypothetical protein OZN62_09235 [Aurantiacibacter sp. MUD11]|uniref:hypothetical protein n=1 Tax=Aurantiacibacter sp. MUD11 TaxID=3003265 RepID=UPI0022AA696B|nr:hypothetical protein [Aurantiacibacter sp. MUD11]WAT17118.1 hypothetical protein OZN62_09235 [Aurantiacibacter sp. MUD11]
MNASTPNFGSASARQTLGASTMSMRWAALAEAGQVVAMLAGLEPEQPSKEFRNFPALMRDAEKWRRDLVDTGCAELAAVMEPGIAALLAVNARGADCKPAALALWREYTAARQAMLELLPPSGEHGPRRSA